MLLSLTLTFFLSFFGAVVSLITVHLNVPKEADIRQDVTLVCKFDLGGAGLYSVKWYKDEFEFYQYMPDNAPTYQTFPVLGVILDQEKSNMSHVTLTSLTFNTSGMYRCEVSTEGPSFQTVYRNASMTVTALPLEDPVIEGVMSTYSSGDMVTAKCIAAKSFPPPTIKWYINNIEVDKWLLQAFPVTDTTDALGLHTRSLGLHFKAEAPFLQSGQPMRLRCTAAVDGRARSAEAVAALAGVTNQRLEQHRPGAADRIVSSPQWMLAAGVVLSTVVQFSS